jgi:carbamoyltransferase
MNILGISAGFHDAAATVINRQGDILFAGHSERYSKQKTDANICRAMMNDVIHYSNGFDIDTIAYYERPLFKQLRQLYSGQGVEWDKLSTKSILQKQILPIDLYGLKTKSYNHHLSHAAAGFQTSAFDKATVVVIDAVGELETTSIYAAEYVNGKAVYKKLWQQHYPHSIGLFYSAATAKVGLRPLDEEYILMGMAAYGERGFSDLLRMDVIDDEWEIKFKQNMHMGMTCKYLSDSTSDMDVAAAAQDLAEDLILNVMTRAKQFKWSNNLVYMGGCALNCAANARIGNYFENIWIMPNPGDAGSSLGAAALVHGGRINWTSAFLGHDIPGPYPVNDILDELLTRQIVGVASGRAEFGPRALGNRSLLGDPRGIHIKEKVNDIKRRQQFRPFAPVILEELADTYFDMPRGWSDSRYMQSVARCRVPELFPAIVHADGTSRVQTVPKDGSGIRELLEKWYVMTGCPMLLNTSLNIRGEPMVNDRADADRFEQQYGVKVCS